MAEGGGDSAWLVDMVIQFMHSPTWNDPLNAFISEKCVMFDNFQDENKHEYVEVHNEFRGLIDNLLTAHLLQVDIQPEDFEKQILESDLAQDPRMQRVVSQLIAAEDFVSFKTMMLDHHIKMQQQVEGNWSGVSAEEEDAANDAAIAAAIAADAAAVEEAAFLQEAASAAEAARIGAEQDRLDQEVAPAATGPLPPVPPASQAAPAPSSPQRASEVSASAAQERSFVAAGGTYGRGSMPTAKKPATNEKAAAIRQELLQI
ncbi:unnamed protein product [Polarella glacialis]|uniref:Cilia- and flagella-associated protein 36 n=1 Tax=Polarella glacialis TaxID=89957 RepID=A0A813KF58_POLGL|nr:unnamed protein product [Polarella glacialis]